MYRLFYIASTKKTCGCCASSKTNIRGENVPLSINKKYYIKVSKN
jgi:hypothetical protein